MTHICALCERTAPDKNLFCVEIECPLRTEPILGAGELVGDARIVRLLHSMRTAAFYEASRGDRRIILKLAHQGCEKQLQNEARLLTAITRDRQKRMRASGIGRALWLDRLTPRSDPHPGIPTLLPAFQNARLQDFPFGTTMLHNREVCFVALEYVDGVPLRDYLAATPQPWFVNAAWIVSRLAGIIDLLHRELRVLHGRLSPDVVWIREDREGHLRPMLMDFGLALPLNQPIAPDNVLWLHLHSENAYIAPELLVADLAQIPDQPAEATARMDIYGLGLLLYEMLAGAPRYTHRLVRERVIRKNVRTNVHHPLRRDDVEAMPAYKPLLRIAETATSPSPEHRVPSDASTLRRLLHEIAGKPPAEKKPMDIGQAVGRVVVVSLLLVCVLLILGVALAPPM